MERFKTGIGGNMATDEEILSDWINSHDGEDFCYYCKHGGYCDKRVSCYGGEPCFPPCADGNIRDMLDSDQLLDDIKTGNA